jgi:hypothetical protein
MTPHHNRHRHHGCNPLNAPTCRRKCAQINHTPDNHKHEHVHPLEALEDLRDLLEEVGCLGFLGRCAPFHVDAEHVCAESEEEMERDAAEEDGEHGHPFEVLNKGCEERFLAETVPEDSQADVAEAGEDNEECDEDAPGFYVEGVNVAVVPADKNVVEKSKWEAEGESVVYRILVEPRNERGMQVRIK